jgi:hypothetical protein
MRCEAPDCPAPDADAVALVRVPGERDIARLCAHCVKPYATRQAAGELIDVFWL